MEHLMYEQTITMQGAEHLAKGIDVGLIAERAAHAAFRVIADDLTSATGEQTWGDMAPGEFDQVLEAFKVFVRSMAINNPAAVVEAPRTILVHLNVEVPADSDVTVEAIEREVVDCLTIGTDHDHVDSPTPALDGAEWCVALAEEI